jgi:hypothetical protein
MQNIYSIRVCTVCTVGIERRVCTVGTECAVCTVFTVETVCQYLEYVQ